MMGRSDSDGNGVERHCSGVGGGRDQWGGTSGRASPAPTLPACCSQPGQAGSFCLAEPGLNSAGARGGGSL